MSVTSDAASATVQAPEVAFDHHSREYAEHAPELLREMRETCPVAHTAAWNGFYPVTGYQEVARILLDDATFSSARSVPGVPEDAPIGITIPPAPQAHVPIDLDPPDNEPYRKLLNPIFSPAASARWEPFIRAAVSGCIDGFIEQGQADFVLDVANPVPALLTCQLMGLPTEGWRIYAEPMHAAVYTPPGTPAHDVVSRQVATMLGKIAETLADRHVNPREDLISTLATAPIDGKPIPDETIMNILTLVLVGGVDTTTSLMASAFHWLGQRPRERETLRRDPALIPRAREEFLRYFTPTQGLSRTVTRPTELAGVPLGTGDRVFMSFAAANRDPAVFSDTDEMKLDRAPNRHTSFGLGVHRCLGSNIARIEFDVTLEEILRRVPDYVVDERAAKRYETIGVVNGWESMPFTFTPGPKRSA